MDCCLVTAAKLDRQLSLEWIIKHKNEFKKKFWWEKKNPLKCGVKANRSSSPFPTQTHSLAHTCATLRVFVVLTCVWTGFPSSDSPRSRGLTDPRADFQSFFTSTTVCQTTPKMFHDHIESFSSLNDSRLQSRRP